MTDDPPPLMLTCTSDAHRLLRQVAEERGISRETIDELAGLTSGYAGKLLSDPPQKGFSLDSLFLCAGALGKALAFVDDARALAKVQKARKKIYTYALKHQWRNAKAHQTARKLFSDIARRAAKAKWRAKTAEQRREHMRHMGKAGGHARARARSRLIACAQAIPEKAEK